MTFDRRYLRAADVEALRKIERARAVNEWAEAWPGPRRPTAPDPDWMTKAVARHLDRLRDVDLEDIAALVHAEIERREDE